MMILIIMITPIIIIIIMIAMIKMITIITMISDYQHHHYDPSVCYEGSCGSCSYSSCIVVFINLIMNHATKREDFSHPGRQMTTFLILVNFSLWFVNTFELQKSQASPVESEVYGAVTWVWLQRLTLPLVIFFRCVDSICPYSLLYFRSKLFFCLRFHSTVVLIDCWKNTYIKEDSEAFI